MAAYGKSYKQADTYELHKMEFLKAKDRVAAQTIASNPQMGFNQMSDWTQERYESMLGLYGDEDVFGE